MANMKHIEELTRRFADERNTLATSIAELEEAKRTLEREFLPRIKALVRTAKAARQKLADAIETSPELFAKPRTAIFHGVRVGLQKAKGEIEFEDVDQVVKLIRRHFPDQFDALVKTTHKPIKKALANLTAAELKKLGIEVTETGDAVFIKDTAGEVDKLVQALLREEPEEVEA